MRPVTLSRAKQTEHRKHKQETQKSKKFLNRISSFSYPPSSDIGFTLVAPALVVRIFNQSRALIDDERERVYNPMASINFSFSILVSTAQAVGPFGLSDLVIAGGGSPSKLCV